MADQPMPTPERMSVPKLWPMVILDMEARHQVGVDRYKAPLQPFNGRSFLRDLHEELLDAVVYSRGLAFELDSFRDDFAFLGTMLAQGNYQYARELMLKMTAKYSFLRGV